MNVLELQNKNKADEFAICRTQENKLHSNQRTPFQNNGLAMICLLPD